MQGDGTMKATYGNIQRYVKNKSGKSVKTCWIADVKRSHHLTTRVSANRLDKDTVKYPCPKDRWQEIEDALAHFGLL